MNVIRMENAKVRPVSRGRRRGKGRDHLFHRHVEEPISISLHKPKYQSSTSELHNSLINGVPQSSSVRTPSNSRRVQGLPSSSSARLKSSASTNLHPATSTSATAESTVVMAITSGRGDARCEVGMAAIDIKFPHLIISQISDSQTYVKTLTKIYLFNPIEIIMPDTMCGEDDPRKKLYNTIKNKFEEINITPVSRMHFNEENGLDRIKTHCANEFSTVELCLKEKYYGLAATAALLKYVEHIQHIIYEPRSMKIEFQASQGATLIDVESAMGLELVTSYGPHKNHSLLSSLDRCVTPMGRRLLRSSILQPPCDEAIIKKRQLCVTELVRNRNLHTFLQPIVKQLFGADRLLGLSIRAVFISECVEAAERNLNYVLLLKTSLEIVPQLCSALEIATSQNLMKIRENLKDPRFQEMREQILEVVQSDARSVNGYTSANVQRCFALKSGINDMLDIARHTYCELIDQTRVLVESLAREHNLPLSVACNASLGYHIQMVLPKRSNFQISELPSDFIEVQKKRSSLYMTTDILMSLSQQCNNARDELHLMSNCILEVLIGKLRTNVVSLFQLSEDIAELDLVMSLARISAIPDYVRPTFGQNLRIIGSKHPILDILGSELPRPNDVEASIPYNFYNITGPNMSGKTTYLKQVVLLHIMAQIGCYLPASEARIRIADRIFCILCPSHEDIESNTSAFVKEMKEIEYILQFVTPNSLIILDEICRSTSAEEGSAVAFAICEKLLQTTAFIFNCSHFIYLTKLTEFYHNVVNQFFRCIPNELDKWGLKYTHKLMNGVTCVENYGISAASAARMPPPVIEKAKQIVEKIAKDIKPLPLVRAPEISWQKDCYSCISKIMNLIISNEYTFENIQLAIGPLRGHKNLKLFQVANISQTNIQKNPTETLQKAQNTIQTQTSKYVLQNDAGPFNNIQYNTGTENNFVHNILQNNPEVINIQQISLDALNLLRNNAGLLNVHRNSSNILQNSETWNHHQINNINPNLLQSNVQPLNINQTDLIGSNLNSYQYQHQSQNPYQNPSQYNPHQLQTQIQQSNLHQIRPSGNFVSQEPEQNSLFKVPIPIKPTSECRINMRKIEQTESQEPIRTRDISSFSFFKKGTQSIDSSSQKLTPVNESHADYRNSSLYEFGFSKEIVDPEKRSSDSQDCQMVNSRNENDKTPFTISSFSQIPNSFSSMKEISSNISSHSTITKKNLHLDQDSNSRRSKSKNLSSLNLTISRNSLQRETVSRSSSFRKNLQSDQDISSRKLLFQNLSPSKLSVSRNSLQKETVSRSSFLNQDLQSDRDVNPRKSQSQNLSHSNKTESEFRSVSPKKPKLDQCFETNNFILNSNRENNGVSLSSIITKDQESLSSFNSTNLSFSLGFNRSSFQEPTIIEASSQTKKNLFQSQDISFSQKSNDQSLPIMKKVESFSIMKKDSIAISPPKDAISEFESILDENTIQIDDVTEFSSLMQKTKDGDILTISSVDTIEAAKSARKKEDDIFNQIDDNANDHQMFIQRIFNSPLSLNFSEELCSCDYEFTP